MNIIGIIGAMDEEIEILRNTMVVEENIEIAKMRFYKGKLNNKDIILVRCGIGKVNATICTQILITHFKANTIINTGVAGGIHDEVDIGDVVISNDVIQHDMNARTFGYKQGEIPRLEEYVFKADTRLIELATEISKDKLINKKVFVGRILSGDIFVSDPDMKNKLWTEFKGYCAEMEGAAIGHTCYLNDVPFVILRAISDKADGSANVNFNEFVLEVANTSANIVKNLVKII